MLRKALTKKSIDHSDTGKFSFSFFCDRCGKEWISPSQPFSDENSPSIENMDALKLIWGNEHLAAFNEANLEAHMHFNLCPVCGRHVCDECFNIAEKEHGGACKDCASKQMRNNEE
jgi:DNA-directed RNA polymerase subunit RPC12/RpoP